MPRFNPKVGDLVYFKWEDHCSYNGCEWQPIKYVGKRLTGSFCETVGFVVDITRDHITTMASVTVNEEDEGDDGGAQVATRLRRAIVSGKIIKRF